LDDQICLVTGRLHIKYGVRTPSAEEHKERRRTRMESTEFAEKNALDAK